MLRCTTSAIWTENIRSLRKNIGTNVQNPWKLLKVLKEKTFSFEYTWKLLPSKIHGMKSLSNSCALFLSMCINSKTVFLAESSTFVVSLQYHVQGSVATAINQILIFFSIFMDVSWKKYIFILKWVSNENWNIRTILKSFCSFSKNSVWVDLASCWISVRPNGSLCCTIYYYFVIWY